MRRRRLVIAALVGVIVPAAANAAVLSEPDKRAIRQLIEAQLKAFAAGDAGRAHAYASAEIQAQLGDADNFMTMVRSGYPMVIRPAAVSFFLRQREEYRLSTLPQDMPIERMVFEAKMRWRIERDDQDLKQDLGLGD